MFFPRQTSSDKCWVVGSKWSNVMSPVDHVTRRRNVWHCLLVQTQKFVNKEQTITFSMHEHDGGRKATKSGLILLFSFTPSSPSIHPRHSYRWVQIFLNGVFVVWWAAEPVIACFRVRPQPSACCIVCLFVFYLCVRRRGPGAVSGNPDN